jgi:spermidine synthase
MLDVDMLQRMRKRMNLHLGDTTGYRLTVPIYHCGEYVFFAAAQSRDPKGPEQSQLEILQNQRNVKTRYWSPQLHHASQVLPPDSDLW